MDLLRRFSSDVYSRALEDWSWLIGDREVEPVAASPFGDVFLRSADGVWFLDMLEGSFARRWPDLVSLQSELSTDEGQDEFLMGGLAISAHSNGVTPVATQVLTFKIPPVLGGPIEVENIAAMDYVVVSSIAGQLHRQVNDLPPGTALSGFTIGGEVP